MRPLRRSAPSKRQSVKAFSRGAARTKAANVAGPMRGGIRL